VKWLAAPALVLAACGADTAPDVWVGSGEGIDVRLSISQLGTSATGTLHAAGLPCDYDDRLSGEWREDLIQMESSDVRIIGIVVVGGDDMDLELIACGDVFSVWVRR